MRADGPASLDYRWEWADAPPGVGHKIFINGLKMKHNSNKKQWVWFKGLHLDCFITTAAFCRRSNINAKTAATPNNNLEIRAAVSLHSPTAPHYRSIDEMTFFFKKSADCWPLQVKPFRLKRKQWSPTECFRLPDVNVWIYSDHKNNR